MASMKLRSFSRLPIDDQIKVLRKVRNYPTLRQNLDMLEKVDPICSIWANGTINFLGNAKLLFSNSDSAI